MSTLVEKRNNNKFCEFHREVGHNTDECMHLKRQIEELIKAGKLSHVIKELKQGGGKDQSKAAKNGEAFGKDKALAILMTEGQIQKYNMNIASTGSVRRGYETFNFYMDEFCGGKITISIQWNHREAMSKENSGNPINSSWNVKILSLERNTNTAKQ
ncbi:hypothetical protein Tco_1447529 [Tanacetum coccineum]